MGNNPHENNDPFYNTDFDAFTYFLESFPQEINTFDLLNLTENPEATYNLTLTTPATDLNRYPLFSNLMQPDNNDLSTEFNLNSVNINTMTSGNGVSKTNQNTFETLNFPPFHQNPPFTSNMDQGNLIVNQISISPKTTNDHNFPQYNTDNKDYFSQNTQSTVLNEINNTTRFQIHDPNSANFQNISNQNFGVNEKYLQNSNFLSPFDAYKVSKPRPKIDTTNSAYSSNLNSRNNTPTSSQFNPTFLKNSIDNTTNFQNQTNNHIDMFGFPKLYEPSNQISTSNPGVIDYTVRIPSGSGSNTNQTYNSNNQPNYMSLLINNVSSKHDTNSNFENPKPNNNFINSMGFLPISRKSSSSSNQNNKKLGPPATISTILNLEADNSNKNNSIGKKNSALSIIDNDNLESWIEEAKSQNFNSFNTQINTDSLPSNNPEDKNINDINKNLDLFISFMEKNNILESNTNFDMNNFDKIQTPGNTNLNSTLLNNSIATHSAPPGQFIHFSQPPAMKINSPLIGLNFSSSAFGSIGNSNFDSNSINNFGDNTNNFLATGEKRTLDIETDKNLFYSKAEGSSKRKKLMENSNLVDIGLSNHPDQLNQSGPLSASHEFE
ncbi:hypothetical protein BB559_001268 [Furculomyces boomerangus]|uniref:Uncharacterized protein n=1 Tax=Furculomyces boomerangus TaxID=61424 RepID=A0A2T9Z2M8_9FUNG|nr:hypothetical protein BB559_001268 [Furculomyces boomerangus]